MPGTAGRGLNNESPNAAVRSRDIGRALLAQFLRGKQGLGERHLPIIRKALGAK